MKWGSRLVISAALGLAGLGLHAEVDFNHEVVPLLKKHCTECHAGDKKKGSFSMNTRATLLEGSENGVMLVPGQVAKSKILELVVSSDPV